MTMLGQYHGGRSILHRLAAGWKLLALVVLALVLVTPPPAWWNIGGGAALVLAGYVTAGVGLGELWRQIIAIRLIIVFLTVIPMIFLPLGDVLGNAARVILVLLLAALVTMTTKTTEILDAVQRLLRPFERFGVKPDRVGLVLALTIRAVPVVAGIAAELRDAQRARSGRMSVRAYVVPLLVQSLRYADDTADALAARGVQ